MERQRLEKISLYKLFLTAFITAFYGLAGWFFVNRTSITFGDKIIVEIAIILLIISIVATVIRAKYHIKLLSEDNDL